MTAFSILLALVAFQEFFGFCQAKTVTYDFNVTWVTANPDGLADRKVVGINGQWPLPIIEVDKGDQLIVNMYNGLGDKNASIHFHGMFQNGTNTMDGPSGVTQCPVPPGYEITYNFTITQSGAYWYHCHTDFCYPDGYRQALIIHDNSTYFHDQVDQEVAVTMSDWYHELLEDIKPEFLSVYNPRGAEPIPQSFLFNDTMNTNIPVEPGKTYLIHLINIGAFVAQYFYIEDHTFQIVAIDGVYTEPTEADILYISVAQRYSILLTAKNSTDTNYAIVTVADSVLLDTVPSNLQLNHTNWLQYNANAAHPEAVMTVDVASDLNPFDDLTLVPYDKMPLLPDPDLTLTMDVVMGDLDNGIGYAFLNNISYTMPKVPTLYTVLSSGDLATTASIYGEFTHPVVLGHNQIVDIILNNNDTGTHPFHLHGHNFQLLARTPSFGPNFYDYADLDSPVPYDPSNSSAFPAYPARRDTFVLPPHGSFVIRFVADNPGVWVFHCHIDWHLSQGLAMSFVEAPLQMQERITVPQNHYDMCKAAGMAYRGNAAGDSVNLLDLVGQNEQPGWLPDGFTPRGIVALTFSIVSAFVGMGFIAWYGMSDLKFTIEDDTSDPAAGQNREMGEYHD